MNLSQGPVDEHISLNFFSVGYYTGYICNYRFTIHSRSLISFQLKSSFLLEVSMQDFKICVGKNIVFQYNVSTKRENKSIKNPVSFVQ